MRIADLPKYELQPAEIQRVEEIIDKHKEKNGALIPILQEIQKIVGLKFKKKLQRH
jgi:NADH:ubiquinone oxidoreductase subunit E